MDASSPRPPLAVGDPAVRELRAALWAADFTLPAVSRLMGFAGGTVTVPPGQAPVVDHQLPRGEPLPTLVRLFLLALPVPAAEAAAAFGTLSLERCCELGVITVDGDRVEATCRIIPNRDLLVLSSKDHEFSPHLSSDHVMSVTPSTNLLADITIRRPVQDALDLCCGGGLQALLAARHARRVVATDLNSHAVEYAAFGAQLSGADNIEFREGDLFEPVAGETFDLVVANPPFIISPDAHYAFRDSPLEGHELSRLVVRGAAEHLREGGLGFILIGWGHGLEDDWAAPLRPWVEGIGCDAWFLRHTSADPVDYAVGFNRPLAPVDPDAYGAAVERWLEYDRRLGFEMLGYGAVVLRKRPGPNWVRTDTLHGSDFDEAGTDVAGLVAVQDMLFSLDGREQLLDMVLRTTEHHRMEQVLRPRDDGYTVEGARVIRERGLPFVASVDVYSAQLLVRLDGKRTLREVLAETHAEIKPDTTPEAFAEAGVGVVVRMLELGFVQPVS